MKVIIPERVMTPEIEATIFKRQLQTLMDNMYLLYGQCPDALVPIHDAIKEAREDLTGLNADIEWRKRNQKVGKIWA